MSNTTASVHYKRHYKVARVLAALTIAFVICWSPFMVTRTMMYFHLTNGDPILYGVYGEAMRQYARSLFKKTGRAPFPRVDPLRDRQESLEVTDSQAIELSFME
ncbi:hypothetical protein pdam_00006762 [Pocillopora damicornis]|uniref:G-protein coupled receptors family 1 profile domain-containing protein n=1 Tax=Pocillopora damicornis TaxID=46731 RepID=A0A3M6UVU0_POCDA|nr:hypothetical protein pdam_00006762 [Pocillopora damicornis]